MAKGLAETLVVSAHVPDLPLAGVSGGVGGINGSCSLKGETGRRSGKTQGRSGTDGSSPFERDSVAGFE